MKNLEVMTKKYLIDEVLKTDLEVAVGEWLIEQLESYEDLKDVLNDLLQNGCSSGMVESLIYSSDTEKFHDTHEDDIWELANEQKDQLGHGTVLEMFANLNGADSVESKGQFKNLLAWYAFEETARDLGHRLEIDI